MYNTRFDDFCDKITDKQLVIGAIIIWVVVSLASLGIAWVIS